MNILYYVILSKTYVYKLYYLFMTYMFNIKEVSIINNDNIKENVTFNYYLFAFINYIISLLEKLKSVIDIETNLVHIIKRTKNGESYMVLHNDIQNISLSSVDNILDHPKEQYMGNVIYRKFCIKQPDNDICCKEYLVKYTDVSKKYNNTMEHVLLFNGVNIEGNPDVEISMRKHKSSVNLKIAYDDIKRLHINDFENIDERI